MEQKIKPGDSVIYTLRPYLGEGTVTYISYEHNLAFVVWGKFGDMLNRESVLCKPALLQPKVKQESE